MGFLIVFAATQFELNPMDRASGIKLGFLASQPARFFKFWRCAGSFGFSCFAYYQI